MLVLGRLPENVPPPCFRQFPRSLRCWIFTGNKDVYVVRERKVWGGRQSFFCTGFILASVVRKNISEIKDPPFFPRGRKRRAKKYMYRIVSFPERKEEKNAAALPFFFPLPFYGLEKLGKSEAVEGGEIKGSGGRARRK